MLIAGSYSQTYKRNAFNNGYIVIECPKLVDDLKTAMKDVGKATIRTDLTATVDFTKSRIEVAGCGERRQYEFAPLGTVAQQLIVMGGLEAMIRAQIAVTRIDHGAVKLLPEPRPYFLPMADRTSIYEKAQIVELRLRECPNVTVLQIAQRVLSVVIGTV